MSRVRRSLARARPGGHGGESPERASPSRADEGADVTRESASDGARESAGDSAEGGHRAACADRCASHDDAAERASIAAAKRSTIAPAGSTAVTPSTLLPACQ